MERNSRLYNASILIVEASKLLVGIEEDNRQKLLDIASDIVPKIKINEEEVRKIERYQEVLSEEIRKI